MDRIINMIVRSGMTEIQAREVLDLAIPKLNNFIQKYNIMFSAPDASFPDVVYTLFFEYLKPTALAWIDKNIPGALFRDQFKEIQP